MRKGARIGLALGIAAAMQGCSPIAPVPPEHPVPSMHLIMGDARYSQLLTTGYVKRWQATALTRDATIVEGRIRLHGATSRNQLRKNYKLQLYPCGLRCPESTLVLTPQYGDPSLCRYRLAHYYFQKTGLMLSRIETVRLFIDGRYEGVYVCIEDVDEQFLRRRGVPVASLYKINGHGQFSEELGMLPSQSFEKHLPEDHYNYAELKRLIALVDQGITAENRGRIESILDIEDIVDYYAIVRLIEHWDGAANNFYLYLQPASGAFTIIPWDLDQTFQHVLDSIPSYQNGLFEQLERIPVYRERLHRAMHRYFDLPGDLAALDSIYNHTRALRAIGPYEAFQGGAGDREYRAIRAFLFRMDSLLSAER
jgi:spore coat protein H